MVVVFLGPPGVGKGTHAKFLEENYGFFVIATGDLLRSAVERKTPLGLEAKAYMERGELVPDYITVGLIREVFPKDGKRVILDGFPRNETQAKALDELLREMKRKLDKVLFFDARDQVIIERLTGRLLCPSCGAVYHKTFKKPKEDELCDRCKVKLVRREDDREEVIKNRLRVYRERTKPLIELYRSRGILRIIDANPPIEEVRKELLKVLFG